VTFGAPGYFALVLVLLPMVALLYSIYRWRKTARENFAGSQASRWPSPPLFLQSSLLLAAAALIVFAAARPQWGRNEIVRDVEGVDLVIVLDVSSSMTANDAQPTRMKLAEDNLTDLVEAQRGSRIGLVLFAGTPFLRSPLTTDSQAVSQLIQRADREAGLARSGSDIGAALQQAGKILESSENNGKAVVLVSDGEDHADTFAAQSASLAQQGVAVYTAGVGTPEGATLYDIEPVTGGRTPKLDEAGVPVLSRLDATTLQAVAEAGQGRYLHLEGSTDLLDLRNDLARLDQTPLGLDVERIPIERYQIFVGTALILLLLSWFLPSRAPLRAVSRIFKRRPHPGFAMVLLALLMGACGGGDDLRERNHEANEMFMAGDFEGALARYQELVAERPDVPELSYNTGNTLHRMQQYERAVAETQRALPPTDNALGPSTYFSLGNHLLALNRLDEAYLAYRNALLLQPSDGDAKFNLELTLLLIQQRDNPQGSDPNRQNGEDDGADQQPQNVPPTPGGSGQPGATGTPQPGEASPAPRQGTPGGEPNGTPGAPGDAQAQQRALEEALAGMDDQLTFEEAVRILDLLRQQQERQVPPEDGSGPDY
jgi:Ca-activated chloride channel family protein